MLVRVLPSVCLLALTACPNFAVGPDAYEIVVRDGDACEEAGLGSGPCSRFDLDNGLLYDEEAPQPLLLQLGFESTERNLDDVTLSYERPGRPPVELTCSFGLGAPAGRGTDELRCYAVVLAGTFEDELGMVERTAVGVLELDLDILANEPGPYAISARLNDDNGFESPTVRWQFTVLEPERE